MAKKKITIEGLRKFNLIMVAVFALQLGLMALIAKFDVKFPINLNYLTFNTNTRSLDSAAENIYQLPLVWPILIFLGLSLTAHLIISTIWYRGYKKDLQKGMNRARWIEYSFSASTMIVAIALLSGIYDLASLIMLFTLILVMNLLGMIMEIHNQTTEKTNWLSYNVGWIAGIAVECHLGRNLRILGRIDGLSVNHFQFNERMVPTLTTVGVTVSRFYDIPAADLKRKK